VGQGLPRLTPPGPGLIIAAMQTDPSSRPSPPDAAEIPVFVLCGGRGTRLRKVESRPKSVIPVAGLPFLAYSLRLLRLQGFRKLHLLLGTGAEAVLRGLGLDEAGGTEEGVRSGTDGDPAGGKPAGGDPTAGDPGGGEPAGPRGARSAKGSAFSIGVPRRLVPANGSPAAGFDVHGFREASPMGTGGALGLARAAAGEVNLILNGDSYAEAIYSDLLGAHIQPRSEAGAGSHAQAGADTDAEAGAESHAKAGTEFHAAPRAEVHATSGDAPLITLLAVWEPARGDYGGLELDGQGRVRAFREKAAGGSGWINGGVYVAGRGLFDRLPEGACSLERDILPPLAAEGRVCAVKSRCFFRDIGTPSRLRRAQQEFSWIRRRMTPGRGPTRPSSRGDR
jgi:NDP-sugar pyrophosphorylase family protein